jgi:integrase
MLILDVRASTPPDDRAPERKVFPGMTVKAIGSMMRRACQRAGIANYHPHDLRHRWVDVYSHVLLDEDGAG